MIHSSIYQLLEQQAARFPNAAAISGFGNPPLTYERLFHHAQTIITQLNGWGIGRNDRVAIVLPNGPEMAVAFLSVACAATSAPLNPDYRAAEYEFHLSDLNAKALVVPDGSESPAMEVARKRGISILKLKSAVEEQAGLFTLAGGKQNTPNESGHSQPGDVALVLHTSGTTSRPKIVPLTQANLCVSAHNISQSLQLSPQDRCLNVMPLFHIHGLMAATLATLQAGANVVCTPGFYAPKFFEWLTDHRPTWYTAVPTMHQAILARARDNPDAITQSTLRLIRSSSSALPPQVMKGLEEAFGVPVIESYGMTEAAHQMASNPLPPNPRKPGSVGIAAGPEVAIMHQEKEIFPPQGETGEVVIRGANVTPGYNNNPEANKSAFTSDGWFRTGDQGYFDEEKYLFLTGRIKEIINRGGEKISPREVDEVLLDHPDIIQAVTFAVPDEKLGEIVAAAVILAEGADAKEPDIRRYAAGRLADFKVPQMVVILDEIPKGPTGKLQRIGLAEKLGLTADTPKDPKSTSLFEPPEGQIEEFLSEIWTEILQVQNIGRNDRFLDLGGDSVMATRLVARIRQGLELEMTLIDFFETPTIALQAETIESRLLEESGEADAATV